MCKIEKIDKKTQRPLTKISKTNIMKSLKSIAKNAIL